MDLHRCVSVLLSIVLVNGRHTSLFHKPRDVAQAAPHELPPTANLITLMSVEKRSVGENRNMFTVNFTENVQNLRLELFDFSSLQPQTGQKQEEDGVTTFTVSVNKTEHVDIVFRVSTLDKTSSILAVIDNSIEEMFVRQDAILMPEFGIFPAGEFVYEPGQDFTFKVFVTAGVASALDQRDPVKVQLHVVDLNTRQFENLYDSSSIVDMIERDLPGAENETTVTIRTSERPVSGKVDVIYSARGTWRDLVKEVLVEKSRVIRPSNQPGALPEGYVGFMQKYPEQCEIGSECRVSCVAVGNSITAVHVQEIIDGEAQGEVTDVKEYQYLNSYTRHLAWAVDTNDQDVAGLTRTFRCQAEDEGHNTGASLDLEVLYVLLADINEDRSNVTLMNVGNQTEAVLTCAVHGFPAPNVTFYLEYEYGYSHGVSPDIVITEGHDELVVSKVVVFALDERQVYFSDDFKGKLLSAVCEADQSPTLGFVGSHFVSYDLPFHDVTGDVK